MAVLLPRGAFLTEDRPIFTQETAEPLGVSPPKAVDSFLIEPRARVSAGDKDTLAGPTGRLVPKDGNSVSGVLAGDTARAGKPSGANLLQPDEANPSNSEATVELGAER